MRVGARTWFGALRACLLGLGVLVAAGSGNGWAGGKKSGAKGKENLTKIIPAKAFVDAVLTLARDERIPLASSTTPRLPP